MHSAVGMALFQKVAVLREYAKAKREGHTKLMLNIELANEKFITTTEVNNAKE